jgi:hypothetical protein
MSSADSWLSFAPAQGATVSYGSERLWYADLGVAANTGAARTGTITVVVGEGDNIAASTIRVLQQAAPTKSFKKAPKPTLSGKIRVGATVKAKTGKWSPTPTSFSYQWLRSGQPIPGATAEVYVPVAEDRGKKLSVRVSGQLADYKPAPKTSKAVKVGYGVLGKGKVSISGKAEFGETLTANPGNWTPGSVSLSYQWYRSGKKISGAKDSRYTLTSADIGKTVKVKVTGSKPGFSTKSVTSKATKKVIAKKIAFTAKPMVQGTAQVGYTLYAVVACLPSDATLKYQWYRSGKKISGATKSWYTLSAKDKGKTLKVKVTASKLGHKTIAATSASTGKVK